MSRVCAIIATRNRRTLLRRCLKALLKQTQPLQGIVVVDNSSSDGTTQMLREEFPAVRLVLLETNTGAAGAFKAGVMLAMADEPQNNWLWLFDDDAEPREDSLRRLLECTDSLEHGRVSVVTPKVILSDGRVQVCHAKWDEKKAWFRMLEDAAYEAPVIEVDVTGNAGPLVACKAIALAGPPNAEMFFVFEDWEWCCRLRHYGPLYVVSDAIVVHSCYSANPDCTPSSSARGLWRSFFEARNEAYVLRTYFSNINTWMRVAIRFCRYVAWCLVKADDKKGRLRLFVHGFALGLTGNLKYGVKPGETRVRLIEQWHENKRPRISV
jgi:rhamnopyranosyl-N-acetylglucosaminyl-diphospho-decaprenol beta-1,3/1,4-galactofuranosyltransferase